MTDEVRIRGAVARHVLAHVPPLVRDSLCADAEFREAYSVRGDYLLTFADSGVVVQRGVLTRAVRKSPVRGDGEAHTRFPSAPMEGAARWGAEGPSGPRADAWRGATERPVGVPGAIAC